MNAPNVLYQLLKQYQQMGMDSLYLSPEDIGRVMPASNKKQLEALHDSIRGCTLCKLCKERTQVVFGVGNPNAKLVFVGEGPGADEDKKGEPFVGRAGQLLTKMIEGGMTLKRSEIYICNVVKCRPPDNRNPEVEEIASCEPFLKQQLQIIKPKVIVALGKFAAQTLLRSDTPISKMRGKWHTYEGIRMMPTYHPAYLLRSPKEKRTAWEDLQEVMRELKIPIPEKFAG
jgi:DNA polymerase